MTKESLLKKQGSVHAKQRHFLKHRHPLLLPVIASALFSVPGLADKDSDTHHLPHQNEARSMTGDLVRIPLGQQPGTPNTGALPRMGASRDTVLRQLGEPRQRRAAIGNPPISSWEYADVVVYFEYDRVVHAVRKHVPVASGH